MEIIELKAQVRKETGKNKIKQVRADGAFPANLYGYQTEPTSLTINSREFMGLLGTQAGSHVIVKLLVDNDKTPMVMVKEIQRDPVRDKVLHVDFLSVALDEKIVAAVPISVVGSSAGVKEGGIIQHGLREVQVEALPTDLPDHLELDISELNISDSFHVTDIKLPSELSMVTPLEELVVTIIPPIIFKEEVPEEEVELEEGEEAEEEAAEEEGEASPSEASEES